MPDEKKFSFVRSISLGNLLSIATMIAGGVAVYVKLEVTNAQQDGQLHGFDRRLATLEASNNAQLASTLTALASINTRLASIERDAAVASQRASEINSRIDRLSTFIVKRLGDGTPP